MARLARVTAMLLRPPAALVLFVFAAIGMAQAGPVELDDPRFLAVLAVVAGWFVNATALNDLADEQIDRVNLAGARGRPLISGDATRNEVLALGSACGVAAVLIAMAIDPRAAAVVAIGLGLNAAYSLPAVGLSGRGALTALLLPLGYTAVPFLIGAFSAGAAVGGQELLLLGAMYVAFIGRIVLKDFRDERGDAMFAKRTLLVRYGPTWTCIASASCWIMGTALLIVALPSDPALLGAFVAYLACALHGLRRLRLSREYVSQQVLVGSIARIGGGMALTLLAHYSATAEQWPSSQREILILVLAAFFVAWYATSSLDVKRVTVIRPW